MKKLILITTLLFCSLSYGQIDYYYEYYELHKDKFTHIKCESTSRKTSYVDMELSSDEILTNTYIEYFAFDENHMFYLDTNIKDTFMLTAWKERNDSEWSFRNKDANSSLTMTESVIKYKGATESYEIDEKTNTMVASRETDITIDRISGNYEHNIKDTIVFFDRSNAFLDMELKHKGKCSPYDPNQRAF